MEKQANRLSSPTIILKSKERTGGTKQRSHSQSVPLLQMPCVKSSDSATSPPYSPMATTPTTPPTRSPKTQQRALLQPYNERGDLYNDFAPFFDRALHVQSCFGCGAVPHPEQPPLRLVVACTGYRLGTTSPEALIYRPLYACVDCADAPRIRLQESVLQYYATTQ